MSTFTVEFDDEVMTARDYGYVMYYESASLGSDGLEALYEYVVALGYDFREVCTVWSEGVCV